MVSISLKMIFHLFSNTYTKIILSKHIHMNTSSQIAHSIFPDKVFYTFSVRYYTPFVHLTHSTRREMKEMKGGKSRRWRGSANMLEASTCNSGSIFRGRLRKRGGEAVVKKGPMVRGVWWKRALWYVGCGEKGPYGTWGVVKKGPIVRGVWWKRGL